MVAAILAFVGIMMIASGFGLRGTVKSFAGALIVLGSLFFLNGGVGWFLDWPQRKIVLIAGGLLLVFSLVAGIWSFLAKFRAIASQNDILKK